MNRVDMTLTGLHGGQVRLRGELELVVQRTNAVERPPARHLIALLFRYIPPALREVVLARTAAAYRGYLQGGREPTPRVDTLKLVDELLDACTRPIVDCPPDVRPHAGRTC